MTVTQQLREAGREPGVPFDVELDTDRLRVTQWLRVLPGKRLVGRGEYRGRPVLAKLFVGASAARHAEREAAGIAALSAAGIATPGVVAQGVIEGGGNYLFTEFLAEAVTLQAKWDALPRVKPGDSEAVLLLGMALRTIARMHAQGLLQGDLHLGNFLLAGNDLYVIDGDAVEASAPGEPLPQRQAETNLALFFAQLTPDWDALQELLLVEYLMINPHHALQTQRLEAEVRRLRSERLNDFLGKTLRDCSQFSVQRSWSRFTAALRSRRDSLDTLLADPDQAFQGPLLKDGGSSTVAKCHIDGQDLLVKRYNIKGFMHWLKRFWRPSRAWHSWQAAHRLRFLGIDTPEPLAMVERRFGPFRHRAWLVTEFCPGEPLLEVLGMGADVPATDLGLAILQTFSRLREARISHGDCKATNFLWDGQRISIIDLDSLAVHSTGAAWDQAWAVDRARFLRNWSSSSSLFNWLDEKLPR